MERPLSLRTLTIYYYRYKDTPYFIFGVFGIVLFISFFLILFVIVPQIQHVVSLQREVEAVQASIDTMQKNQEYIASISDVQEKEQTDIVLAALPIVKDYAGIYTAIVTTSASTGVGLSNFQYSVGVLDDVGSEGNTVSEMKVSLTLFGSPTVVNEYLQALQKTLPLSTVNLVSGNELSSQVEVAFFYGGEKLIQIDPKLALPHLSSEKQQLISTLSSYRPKAEPVFVESLSSTQSGFSEAPF